MPPVLVDRLHLLLVGTGVEEQINQLVGATLRVAFIVGSSGEHHIARNRIHTSVPIIVAPEWEQ